MDDFFFFNLLPSFLPRIWNKNQKYSKIRVHHSYSWEVVGCWNNKLMNHSAKCNYSHFSMNLTTSAPDHEIFSVNFHDEAMIIGFYKQLKRRIFQTATLFFLLTSHLGLSRPRFFLGSNSLRPHQRRGLNLVEGLSTT